jgi:predicted  nucleic acid-binding Zn-ribbon protein
MVEVINILAIATDEVISGRMSESMSLIFTVLDSHLLERGLKQLVGNSDIEDSLEKLDKLTQEEARMAQAELLKVLDSVDQNVTVLDKIVKGADGSMKRIEGEVRNAHSDVQDVEIKVEGFEESVRAFQDDVKDVGSRVQIVGSDIKDISSEIRDIDDKVGKVKRS